MGFELFIGGRYLRAKQKQAFISLITILSTAGVAVGVMALIVVIAVMAGFEADLKSRILGGQSQVILKRHGGAFTQYRQVLREVEQIEGVEAATPFILSQIILRAKHGASGAVLRGIDPKSAGRVMTTLQQVNLPDPATVEAPSKDIPEIPGIVLGRELARNLMYDYDQTFAFINIIDAQKIMRMGNSVTGLDIRVTDIYDAGNVAQKITAKLKFPFWAIDWMQMNRNLFKALKLERKVMFIILTLIILVAAFNIASSLIMMVLGKTRDIAILKAMGATEASIRKIFVFNGMVIGTVGTLLGLGLGLIVCFLLKHINVHELAGDIYYFTTSLPVKLEIVNVVSIIAAALVICFLATLYPARQASKLNPIEAIRYG